MAEDLYGGQITIYPPTPSRTRYRIRYYDTTGASRFTTGGSTLQEARARAAGLMGIATPERDRDHNAAPTAQQAFTAWLNVRKSGMSSRTVDNYEYTFNRRDHLHGVKINKLTPQMLSTIDTTGMSRDTQKKIKSIWRQTLTHHKAWLHYTPAELVDSIAVTGTRRADDRSQVDARIIPSLHYVHTLMARAWSTENAALDDITTVTTPEGFHTTIPDEFTGMPEEFITDRMRKPKKHYRNTEHFTAAERARVGKSFQSAALIAALGSGALMRIGEVMALRIHHVLDDRAVRTILNLSPDHHEHDETYRVINTFFTGRIRVDEQASAASKGRLVLSKTKGGRRRTTTLPSFLPTVDATGNLHTPPAERARGFSQHDALDYWMTHNTPALRLMLISHLTNLFTQWRTRETTVEQARYTMLFPTSTHARRAPEITDGLNPAHHGPDPLTNGGYRTQANYSNHIANPLYDYISACLHEYPTTPDPTTKRDGYTHHGLRHLGISTQLKAGRPVVDVSADAGHRDAGFTLARYSHLLRDAHAAWEF